MKKFEEEVKGKAATMATQPGCSMTRKVWYNADDIHELSDGWVSPEDHQAEIEKTELQNLKYREEIAKMQKALRKKNKAIKELNGAVKKAKSRLKECEDLRIEANNQAAMEYSRKCEVVEDRAELKREIEKLKSQLKKQQPEIPEFVATEIERLKNDGAKTLSELYSADIKWLTYGTTYLNGNDLKLAEWFYDNTETFELAFIHGYTGAKEKRFYLKHIDMSKADKNYDWYITRFNKGLAHEAIDKERVPEGLRFKFTQQKIDSMETGSYEQIEVEE